jgi:hypothetical protein
MTRTEEFVVVAIVIASTVGRLFYQARVKTKLRGKANQ